MGLFLSTVVNKVDKKGRVSVPATFRTLLAPQDFQGIIVYRAFSGPYLEGSGMDFLEQLAEASQDYATFAPEQEQITSLIFADARQLAWDPEGRVVLPEDVLAHAGITDSCAFVGKGRTFQIWEPETYRTLDLEARARVAKNPTPILLRKPVLGDGK